MEFKLDMDKLKKVIEDTKEVHKKLDTVRKEACLEMLDKISDRISFIIKPDYTITKQYFANDGALTGELTINNKTGKEEFFIVVSGF